MDSSNIKGSFISGSRSLDTLFGNREFEGKRIPGICEVGIIGTLWFGNRLFQADIVTVSNNRIFFAALSYPFAGYLNSYPSHQY